jgi:arylsulfatase
VIPPYLIDGPATREDLTGYYHEVSRFDYYIGQVVRELANQNVLDNTMIIVMADNGRPFPRCKTRLYDDGIKTPFIVHFPQVVKPAVTHSLISTIDLAPTVLQVAGLEIPERIQGLSFTPILTDPTATTRQVAFAEHNWHVYKNHERMVRTGDWLYIRNNFPYQQNLCVEAYMGGAGTELWEAHAKGLLTDPQMNIFWNPCPAEELYNVKQDPDQLDNLAAKNEYQETTTQMRRLLSQWTEETGDTLPQDPTPHRDAPPGEPPRSRKGFQHREMPGDAKNAGAINNPGPR